MSEPANYRALCFKEHGGKCALCDSGENVVAHHINGDRSDDRVENLLPTCRSCHSKIHMGIETELAEKLPAEARIDRPEVPSPNRTENTTIRVTPEVADNLHDRKERGESYDDVLRRVLNMGESDE